MVWSIVLLAVSLSLDALVVGMAYGLRKVKIPLPSKLVICFFSIAYSGIALMAGSSLAALIPAHISKIIGILLLFAVGIMVITNTLFGKEKKEEKEYCFDSEEKTLAKFVLKSFGVTIQVVKNPVTGDIDKSGVIDLKESLLLGLALSVDAIGAGVGSALVGFNSVLIPFSVGLTQFVLLYAGTFLGERFSPSEKVNKKLISILPGILLIILAVLRLR